MTNPTLTKKCASCGLEKPLTAFLIIETQIGTQYGNICSSCRKAKAQQTKTTPKDIEESSGTVDRHTIDNKAKVAIEQDSKQRQKEKEALAFEEETDEKEKITLELEKETAFHEEKKHKKDLFDSLLSKTKPKIQERFIQRKVEEHTKQQDIQQQEVQKQEVQKQETQRQEHERTQKEVNELNFTNPLTGPTDRLKHQSIIFRQFLATVGEGSAIAKNLMQLQDKQTKAGKIATSEPTVEDLTKHLGGPSTTRKK